MNQKGCSFIGVRFAQTAINSGITGLLVDESRLEFLGDRPTFLDIFGRTSKNAITRSCLAFKRTKFCTSAHGRRQSNNEEYDRTKPNFPQDVPKQQTYGFLLSKASGRKVNRYPWLQHEKIPGAKPDHRTKQDEFGS